MKQTLRTVAVLAILIGATSAQTGITRYVRFSYQNAVAYGVLEGETSSDPSSSAA